MLEKPTFNTLINHIIFTMDNLLKNKDYSEELTGFLYLIATGMVLSYGDSYIEDIYNMLSTVKFTNNKEIRNYSNKEDILSYVNPTNHNYLSKLFDYECKFPTINFDYQLYFKKIDSSDIKTLEFLVHELNYILFNKNKKYSIMSSIRIRYDYLRNDIDLEEDKDMFYRVINVLQSEDIIKRILELRKYDITNKKFTNALDKLADIDDDIYQFEGLNMLVNLFRPLYKFKDTKSFIDRSMFSDSDLIECEFDKILGKNSYRNVCKKLNTLNSLLHNTCSRKDNYYALSVEYVDIRNNFVKKYIDIKYLKQI